MDAIKVWITVVSFSNLLLILCYDLEANQTYHIKHTSKDSCPEKPCLTLSQFARSPSTRINTTLVFLPGKHSLGWKLSVADIEKFSMTLDHNDSGTEILCHQSGGFHFTNVHAIHISGLDFVGCARNRVENVNNFTLEDSNFFGKEGTGTTGAALELYSTSIVISRSSFKFYRGSVQQVHSIGCTMSNIGSSIQTYSEVPNTERYRVGGAIFTINSSTTIVDSIFERNSANIGGAIFAECHSNLTINNSVFIKNHVQCNIYISKCYGGGVLYARNGVNVTIYGSQFHLNTAYKYLNAGVLMAEMDTIINIHASQFTNNRATLSGCGGVIYITDRYSTSNLIDTNQGINMNVSNNFAKNSSDFVEKGEQVVTFGKVTLIITNSEFFNNFASSCGGVIKMDAKASHSLISITDSIFSRNSALTSGGVIDIHANDKCALINITKSDFTGNSAGTNGGVIHSDQASVTISESCKFDHNTALNNGGVVTNHQGSLKILGKCKFSQNKAYNDGGVVHTYKGTVSVTNGNSFNSNMAHVDGGVIYGFESDINISRVNVVYNNTAHDGGAISVYEGNLIISYRNIFRRNVAHEDGGVIYTSQSNTKVFAGNVFSHNIAIDGAAIHAYQQNLEISDTKLLHNKASSNGGAVWAYKVNTKTTRNVYNYNHARNRGGVWYVYEGCLKVLQSNLSHNEAADGGAIFDDMGDITVKSTSLVGNRASKGGALHTYQSTVFIVSTGFSRNSAQKDGGGWLTREGNASIIDSVFDRNSASNRGGTWHVEDSNVILEDIIITDSYANIGAALYATGCTLKASKSLLINRNKAHSMGTVYLSLGSFIFNGEMELSENHGSFVILKSKTIFSGTTKITNCSEPVRSHDKFDIQGQEGGGLTLLKSRIIFSKSTKIILLYNFAEHGGGIHAAESRLYLNGVTLLANNLAKNTGGGLYLYHSQLNSRGSSSLTLFGNEAVEKGGGVHAISSTVNVQAHVNSIDDNNVTVCSGSKLFFVENKAKMGGGLYLDIYAKLYILKSAPHSESYEIISFTHNMARYGGAIYESDCSDSGVCPARLGTADFRFDYRAKKCSIQIVSVNYGTPSTKHFESINNTSKSVFFYENLATVSGSSLFEGLKRQCTIRTVNEQQHISTRSVNGISYLINISNITEVDIGSKPAQLCFCKDGKADCLYQPHLVRVMKGGRVTVELVAIDSASNPVNATVHSSLLQRGGKLGEDQVDKITNKTCTEFNFNIFSTNNNEVLNMHISNTSVKQTLTIQFITCNSCPVGFTRVVDENSICKCVCDPELEPYITDCNASQETLTREGDFWITYFNTSDDATNGYLIYPFCPYNYCLPHTSKVDINLNLPDGADSQCANGHSGLLCGQCQSGLSLSLGSSRCMPCSTKWPIMLVVMLTVALLAGIVLVVLLMSINLTVAVGTLNSIIFYANIVDANSSIFLPFSMPNIATVFIAGLNLKIGFDICFFEGMDAYWKTLIQLAFPLYVIFLVIVIIFTTECSTKFAKLLARKNPVATLATLILLSYSKLLQTVIASLSFATLQYPDGSYRIVWLPNASVEYLRGKHIVLFIIAVLTLIAGGIYTTLLFNWQWLLRHQNKKFLRWMKYQKLCHFIEPYHAPYAFSQRYWFGLLLIARIPVYIVSAITNDPRLKLLLTSTVIIGLLVVKVCSLEKQIYRKRLLDILGTIMHVNIVIFSVLTWYTFDAHSSQQTSTAVAYLSVCVTFSLLTCVILYHIFRYTTLFSKAKSFLIKLLSLKRNTVATCNHIMSRIPDDTSESTAIVTFSTVELSECTSTTEADTKSSDHSDQIEEAHSSSS